MHIGMIGLGKMGFNMRERLRKGGVEVTGYDRNWEVTDVASIDRLVVQVPAPRIIWVMVPAGALSDAVITEHSEKLERGDMVIDGGNSRFTERALPVFDALRPGGERSDSFIHVGGVGGPLRQNGAQRHRIWSDAGLPEGFHLLAAKDIITDLLGTFRAWQKGTVVRSWLLDLPVKALEGTRGCKKSTTRRGFGALPPVRRPRNPDRRSRGSKLTGLGCVPAWSEPSKPACSNRKSTRAWPTADASTSPNPSMRGCHLHLARARQTSQKFDSIDKTTQ